MFPSSSVYHNIRSELKAVGKLGQRERKRKIDQPAWVGDHQYKKSDSSFPESILCKRILLLIDFFKTTLNIMFFQMAQLRAVGSRTYCSLLSPFRWACLSGLFSGASTSWTETWSSRRSWTCSYPAGLTMPCTRCEIFFLTKQRRIVKL